MGGPASGVKSSFWRKPFALWVIFVGLVYMGLAFFGLMFAFQFFDPTFVVFAALFIVAGIFSMAAKRWAILLGTAVSILFLGLFAPLIASTFANPASPAFWLAVSGIPILVLIVIFAILSLAKWKRGISNIPYLATPRSTGGLFALSVVGFIIGGLIVGNLAATTIVRLLGGAGAGSADIQIVRDAASPSTAVPFSPATFTIQVGETVTWYNSDTMDHSVTSDTGSGVTFDSGLLQSGSTFTFTFTQAGTYNYHCTPHPQMTGTIVVTP